MLKKVPKTNHLLDKLHKTFVLGCIGFTVGGFSYIFYRGFVYFKLIKPVEQKKLLEENIETNEMT